MEVTELKTFGGSLLLAHLVIQGFSPLTLKWVRFLLCLSNVAQRTHDQWFSLAFGQGISLPYLLHMVTIGGHYGCGRTVLILYGVQVFNFHVGFFLKVDVSLLARHRIKAPAMSVRIRQRQFMFRHEFISLKIFDLTGISLSDLAI